MRSGTKCRALLLWALVAGCGVVPTGDADPMPSPDPGMLLVSASNAIRSDGGTASQVGVIGLAGAVSGAGYVEITNTATSSITVVTASGTGSFAAVFSGAGGDRLQLRYRATREGPASDPVTVVVNAYSYAGGGAPTPGTGPGENDAATGGGDWKTRPWLESSPPDASGKVSISGGMLTAGLTAAVGNQRTGAVLELTVQVDGTIQGEMTAGAGDTLVVIVRNPDSPQFPSQVAAAIVPAS